MGFRRIFGKLTAARCAVSQQGPTLLKIIFIINLGSRAPEPAGAAEWNRDDTVRPGAVMAATPRRSGWVELDDRHDAAAGERSRSH